MSILKFEHLTGKEPYIDSKLKLQNYDPLIYSLFKLNVQTASIHYFMVDETANNIPLKVFLYQE